MTSQYDENQQSQAPESEDSAPPELSDEEKRTAEIQRILRNELGFIDRRFQSAHDRNINEVRSVQARLSAIEQTGVMLEDLLSRVNDLYEDRFSEEERKSRDTQRQLARLQKAAANPPQQPQETLPQMSDAEIANWFNAAVMPDLEAHARTRGMQREEFMQAWNSGQIGDLGNLGSVSLAEINAYKERKRAEIDRFVSSKANQSRVKTAPANPRTSGGGTFRYNGNESLDAISDKDFNDNLEAIARTLIESKRR